MINDGSGLVALLWSNSAVPWWCWGFAVVCCDCCGVLRLRWYVAIAVVCCDCGSVVDWPDGDGAVVGALLWFNGAVVWHGVR